MTNDPGFNELMDKYLAGKASEAEWNELRGLISKGNFDEEIKNRIDAEWDSGIIEPGVSFERYHEMIGNIMSAESHIASIIPLKRSRRRSVRRLALAAVVTGLLVLPFAGWWWWHAGGKQSPVAITGPAAAPAAEEVWKYKRSLYACLMEVRCYLRTTAAWNITAISKEIKGKYGYGEKDILILKKCRINPLS